MLEQEQNSQKKTFFGGVLVLMPAALFAKIIGLFYKIPLIAIVGVEGMAYFLAAYHIYSLLFVLSATGLPTALSLQVARAVAEGRGNAVRRVFGVALALFLSLGLVGTLSLVIGADALAARLSMGDAAASIVAIAPALLLAAFIGAARGFTQGKHHMLPTALSEVLEAAGKLGFGLAFALLARSRDLPTPTVAAYAIFGITAGMALSALWLGASLVYFAVRERTPHGTAALPARRRVLGELCRVALPVTVSASVMSLVSLLDTALISGRLQAAGFAPAVANAMYSSYGNLAIPLYNLVPSLLSPLTLALMPLLGACCAKGDHKGSETAFGSALRLTALFSIPAAMGLAVFARPILSLIYQGQDAAVSVAAPLLSILALSVPLAALITLAGAALQATGHTLVPVLAMGAGALVKLAVEVMLLAVPAVHIYGAPISTLACNATVLTVELIALLRVLPFCMHAARGLLRPFFAALGSVGSGAAAYLLLARRFGEPLWLILAVLFLVMVLFAVLALRFRAVEEGDLLGLPQGERLCGVLKKCKLLKR